MKILFFVLCSFTSIALSSGLYAQKSKGDLGLGLRLTPDGGGFTVKYFMNPDLALEGQLNAGGIFGLEGESFNAVALFEYHISFPDPSWRVFFGGGAHVGAWDRSWRYYNERGRVRGSDFIFGIDGIGGVEYKFKKIPLALSGDLKPAVNFVSDVDFFPHNMVGVAARYYIR